MNLRTNQREELMRILGRWEESILAWQQSGLDRDRDSAVLRFELTFELLWKYAQALIRDQGLDSAGPRQAFSNAHRLGWIDDEVIWDDIIRARNLAVHIYRETLAEELAQKLPAFHAAFTRFFAALPISGGG